LALRADGRVYGWGDADSFGLPGEPIEDWPSNVLLVPTLLDGIEEMNGVHAGGNNCNLFLRDGLIYQYNYYGDYSFGLLDKRLGDVVKLISTYRTILALRADGTVWGMGPNSQGELANTGYTDARQFVPASIDHVVDISAGAGQIAALRDDGTVWRWGSVLLADDWENLWVPRQDVELTDVASMALGYGLAAAHHDGSVTVLRQEIVPMPTLQNIVRVFGNGYYTSYALDRDGNLWGWGETWLLGIGVIDEMMADEFGYGTQFTPRQTLISDVADVSVGIADTIALDTGGTVWAWGTNLLGDGNSAYDYSNLPVAIISSE
jgi:alpha-tubulin suppressor-like RCC1 family protein